ncbi:MAG TPA: hypothetical protein VF214_01905 [Edaphobacter sp.]
MKRPLRSLSSFAIVVITLLCAVPPDAAAQPSPPSLHRGPNTSPPSPPPQPDAAQQTVKVAPPLRSSSSHGSDTIAIPGQLRSFLRMAGISQKAPADQVLPLLARNVFIQGYQVGKPTEFLVLLQRYVQQAQELQILAGSKGAIHVSGCDDSGTLLQILGYRVLRGCEDKNTILSTADPEKAFITIDSGFPLAALEEALQKGAPFDYPYPSTRVPVLFRESDWIALSSGRKRGGGTLINTLLRDPEIARLYWAMAKIETNTANSLQHSPGLPKLLPYGPLLDFYGSQLRISSGRLVVPGGKEAEPAWRDLAGASPEAPGEFVLHLVAKDNGWLAAYFDALARVSPAQQKHLTESPRLKRVYDAFHEPSPDANAATGVFRRAPGLLVLFTRVQWDPNGDPHVPGDLAAWRDILGEKSNSKIIHSLGKRAHNWDHPEQLLEAMASLARVETDTGPLQAYLTLSAIDSARPPERRLSPETVRLLADNFAQQGSWYLIFSEFPELSDESISRFMAATNAITGISNQTLKGNALGAFQANVGLWQILARQGEIPAADMNVSWQKLIAPFTKVGSPTQLFDATRASLSGLVPATAGKTTLSQGELVDLLAGPSQTSADGQTTHAEIAAKIRSVLDDQRLVSLDTLFALSDDLHAMSQGGKASSNTLALAGELREFEMPRPIFTNSEKISWAPRVYVSHHAELQVRTDLTKVIKTPGSPAQLEAARGQLLPFLRDTLVGLNYAYYEPPGAQVLHNNSLFVRSHDFSGVTVVDPEGFWQAPQLLGIGTPAGGGAYLMGSLADLPHALAMAEQEFIAPENVQALIWEELVPDLLISAIVPRWWDVTSNELHAVTLYQKSGEEILTASAKDPALRDKVISILSDRMSPQRLEQLNQTLINGEDPVAILYRMMPADTFYLAAEFRTRHPGDAVSFGSASQQLDSLCHSDAAATSPERLARDFGVPHPILARTYGSALLNVKPFPSFGGDSSRLFGESWESSNLYWARLIDEKGYSPVMLNRYVPVLTHRMTAKIFATELEDWPALQRAMLETGEEFQQGKLALQSAKTTAMVESGGVK